MDKQKLWGATARQSRPKPIPPGTDISLPKEGTRPAACPSARMGTRLLKTTPQEFVDLEFTQWCSTTWRGPATCHEAIMQHPGESLDGFQARGDPSLSLHQLSTWDKWQLLKPQCPALYNGRMVHTHHSSCWGGKIHARVTLRAKPDLTSTTLSSAITGFVGVGLLPSVFTSRLEAQHADDMTRWEGKSWKVSQLWKKERFLGTHNKQEKVSEHSQIGKMLGTNTIKEKANIFTLFWKLIFINCCIILDSFIFPSFI